MRGRPQPQYGAPMLGEQLLPYVIVRLTPALGHREPTDGADHFDVPPQRATDQDLDTHPLGGGEAVGAGDGAAEGHEHRAPHLSRPFTRPGRREDKDAPSQTLTHEEETGRP